MLRSTLLVCACLALPVLPPSISWAGVITVDSTGISIGSDTFPFVEDLIVPDMSTSPFFSTVLNGVRNGVLTRRTPPGTHINFDGSAVFMDGVTGSLGTFTWIVTIPAGGFHFENISDLPPELFPPAGFLLSTVGTLTAVSGPGFSTDKLAGTIGWHNKVVLTGPFIIPGDTPLTSLPSGVFAASAWHVSMDALASFHSSSSSDGPEPSTLSTVCVSCVLLGWVLKHSTKHNSNG